MPQVEFFDWKLNIEHPISVQNIAVTRFSGTPHFDIHSALHLLIVNRGVHYGRCGNWQQELRAGDIFLSAPWEPHCSLPGESKSMVLINISPDAVKNFFFAGYGKIEILLAMPPEKRFEYLNSLPEKKHHIDLLNTLAGESAAPARDVKLWHAVLALLLDCDPPEDAQYVDPGTRYRFSGVLQKLSNKGLALEDAARLCNLSVSRFSTLFKSCFGLSYARYERLFRLNGAAGALSRGATLKEAAAEWGFCDKSHLARLLKAQKSQR